MMRTLAAFLGVALCTACTFGQVGIDFNASTASPAVYHPGETLDLRVHGPAGAPFAALISTQARFEVTPYGLLLADPLAPEAVTFFDGFDPYSPTYGTANIPIDGSPFLQTFIPFEYGHVYAPKYYVQALVADPSHPLGLRLTNEIDLVYDSPPPTITAIQPTFVSPLTAVTVIGNDFEPVPALNVVKLNGVELQVLAATPTSLFVLIPVDARSGPISVETTHGSTPSTPEAMSTWLAVTPALFLDAANAPPLIDGPVSIIGSLLVGQHKDFVFHIEEGEELLVEAYVFDLATYSVTAQANGSTPYFDPIIRVRRNPALPITVLTDDDSGPQVTAAVGLPSGPSPHYVAPFDEDVVVQIDSQSSASGGPFLLTISKRAAIGMPVTVQALVPCAARIGDYVTVVGSGFDPANLALHTVQLNGGVSVVPDVVTPGTLLFQVPPGARSGPVVVVAPGGQSPYNTDRIESWLCVHPFTETYAVEGTVQTIPAAGVVRGSISPAYDLDDFQVDLVAGQTVSFECHAFDPSAGCFVSGAILMLSPLDVEVRIMTTSPVPVILAMDQNSGPGLGAGMGLNATNPPFTAPYTGTYVIRLSSFFSWSQGEYFFAIGPGP